MRLPRALPILLFVLGACGTDPGTVTTTFLFQSLAAQNNTDTIHVYVLRTKGEVDCGDLVADVADPLDTTLELRGDVVVVYSSSDDKAVIEDIAAGKSLVYAEASNVVGETILAGCGEISVDGDSEIELTLAAPGTFDCSDPDTQSGAPCDDGSYCTTGESCQGGSCVGGGPRNCQYLENDCNTTECSEALGCQPMKVDDDSPCEDGVFCTAGDYCVDGECIAGSDEPDCTLLDNECSVGTCSAEIDDCVRENDDAPCNTDACQIGTCNISGTCDYVPYDCPPDPGHDCFTVACSDNGGAPYCHQPINQGGDCDDQCTIGGTCDTTGTCTGGTPQTPPETDEVGLCNDLIDNDCDGLIDYEDIEDCPFP